MSNIFRRGIEMLKKSRIMLSALFLLFGLATLSYSQEVQYSAIVAFGDSMSDNGVSDGYGFTRKSNGKVWVEHLSDMIECKNLEVRAWSGATSGIGNYNSAAKDWSGLQWQIDQYVAESGKLDETLFTLEIGTNDLHDPNMKIQPKQVVENLITAVENLADKGAKNFLLWNLPVSIVSPGYVNEKYEWYSYYNPLLEGALKQYEEFNIELSKRVKELKKSNPELSIKILDMDNLMKEVKSKFKNTTDPWQNSYLYPKKGEYFWYDEWHYMSEVHYYIAQEAYRILKKTEVE